MNHENVGGCIPSQHANIDCESVEGHVQEMWIQAMCIFSSEMQTF
jgi:hypothetical protein